MEKNEKAIVTILLVMATLLFVPVVSAAALSATWNSPATYSNLSTSFTYNCTTTAHAVRNVTVYANSSAGVMNSLQVFTNTSAAQTAWTGTVSIQAADDGANQNLSCYADNSTNQAYSAEIGATGILLDSTNPTCSLTVSKPNIAYKGLQTIDYSTVETLSWRATNLTVDGPGKHTTFVLTAQTRTVNLGSNDTSYVGSWTISLSGVDWAGNTCSKSATFKSYLGDVEVPDELPAKDYRIIWLIIIAIIAYLIFKKK